MFSKVALALIFFGTMGFLPGEDSITGRAATYRETALRASCDAYIFQNFRSIPEYRTALELSEGEAFAAYIASSSRRLRSRLGDFRKLDTIGNPPLREYPAGIGSFSGTTLRYIVLADQVRKMFSLPKKAVIGEIGAGFGGQCYILSILCPFSQYYIYDLPEVEALIGRVADTLNMKGVLCLSSGSVLPVDKFDLLISNYAFSECDRATQLSYFDRVVKKADRGFMIYNQISKDFNVDSLSPDEFVQLLEASGKDPKILKEPISTAPKNLLIVWGTKR